MDVVGLYPNIPHEECLPAFRKLLFQFKVSILRLLFVTKEKKIPLAKFPILPTGGNTPYLLNAIWKTLPVVAYEQNFG